MVPSLAPRKKSDEQAREERRVLHGELIPFPEGHLAPALKLPKTGKYQSVDLSDFDLGGRVAWMRPYLPMALKKCQMCAGIGIRFGYKARLCDCVLRRIGRALTDRYRLNQAASCYASSCYAEISPGGKDSRLSWGRKNEEFSADLWLLSKRTLDAETFAVFVLHSLTGHEWRYCTRRLGIDRGTFFHAVYRAEVLLAKAAIALEPYPLFPLSSYFGSTGHRVPSQSLRFHSKAA